jgi:hypothetical protein
MALDPPGEHHEQQLKRLKRWGHCSGVYGYGRELTIRAPYGSPRDAYLAVAAFSHASVDCFCQRRTRGRRVAAVNLRAGLRLEPIFDFAAGSEAACLGAIVGLSLIFVPRVPVETVRFSRASGPRST